MGERDGQPEGSAGDYPVNLRSPDRALVRVRELPGGAELLAVAAERAEDAELVGGAVRDILLGNTPRELDVVVSADAHAFAAALARRLGARTGERPEAALDATYHERFGTALVRWPEGQIDVATRRTESYASPGALPDVRSGTPEQDLARRDFTANAIAISLAGDGAGELRAVERALEDLAAGRLRVLHEKSFIDDPTRLLRIARYAARLGFEIEARTAELASQALAAGALDTVSGARIGAELRLALAETNALASVMELSRLGVLTALDGQLHLDERLIDAACSLLAADGRADLLLLASLLLSPGADAVSRESSDARALLDRLEFPAADRDRVLASIAAVPRVGGELAGAIAASALHSLLSAVPPEGAALAAASTGGQAARNVRRFAEELRHVRLRITGDDLIAAGVPVGPEIGRRLEAVLHRRLDGELEAGREVELQAALRA